MFANSVCVLALSAILLCVFVDAKKVGILDLYHNAPDSPCTQCLPIHIQPGCSGTIHEEKYDCAFAKVNYHTFKGCARATVLCATADGKISDAVILGGFHNIATNSTDWNPISPFTAFTAHTFLDCTANSTWANDLFDSRNKYRPFFIRCAHVTSRSHAALTPKIHL